MASKVFVFRSSLRRNRKLVLFSKTQGVNDNIKMSECCWIFFSQYKATFPYTTLVSVAYVDCYTLPPFYWNCVSRLKTGKSLDGRSQMCWLLCLKGPMSIKVQWFQYFCEFVVDIKETVEILHAWVKTRLLTSVILAVIKQLYKRFSAPVHLSVRPSICLSVCHTFLTMYLSSYRHDIFRSDYHWQERGCPQGLFLPANLRHSHIFMADVASSLPKWNILSHVWPWQANTMT